MYFMIFVGYFLMFFIGLEMVSILMVVLVVFDKYCYYFVEVGVKYILIVLFLSVLLLFGFLMIYGMFGMFYFNDFFGYIIGNMF